MFPCWTAVEEYYQKEPILYKMTVSLADISLIDLYYLGSPMLTLDKHLNTSVHRMRAAEFVSSNLQSN